MSVPAPARPTNLASWVLEAESTWWNVTREEHADAVFNASSVGDARFSPLFDRDGGALPVTYLARHPVGAMLETVFHNVWRDLPGRVSLADVEGRVLRRMSLATEVRVVDLRDARLSLYGLDRTDLVATSEEDYPDTRAWADLLVGAKVGGRATFGLGWQSRIVEIARAAATPLTRTMLVGEQTEVAAVFDLGLPAPSVTVDDVVALDSGGGLALIQELAVAVGGFVDLG